MNGKFLLYAIVVSLLSTTLSWSRMLSSFGNANSYRSGYSGSSWGSTTGGGGGSWGGGAGGGGHK
jgi:uncharacterized membrane protein